MAYTKSLPIEVIDIYQGLFNHMANEHDLILTNEEMNEIIIIVSRLIKNKEQLN